MRFVYYITVALALSSPDVFAQDETIEPIETDRPDQTETPSIVPKGRFQMENGFSYGNAGKGSENFVLPSSLLKYGLNGTFEFRVIAEFTIDQSDGKTNSGLSPVYVGFKANICDEKGIIPKTSFIGHISLPNLATSQLKTTFYAPKFRFTMQHTITDKLDIGYNLGAEWSGETAEPTFIYTLTTGISISAKAGCYLEIYGFAPQQNKANHNFDGGFTYLLSNNFMIDASGGFGITVNAPDYYAALGFSFRI